MKKGITTSLKRAGRFFLAEGVPLARLRHSSHLQADFKERASDDSGIYTGNWFFVSWVLSGDAKRHPRICHYSLAG
jgi:hypothetical protein